jgi:hypothetical protein
MDGEARATDAGVRLRLETIPTARLLQHESDRYTAPVLRESHAAEDKLGGAGHHRKGNYDV